MISILKRKYCDDGIVPETKLYKLCADDDKGLGIACPLHQYLMIPINDSLVSVPLFEIFKNAEMIEGCYGALVQYRSTKKLSESEQETLIYSQKRILYLVYDIFGVPGTKRLAAIRDSVQLGV